MTMFERIMNTAKKRGMSLREVNDKAKLGPNAIYRWKRQTPSVDKITKVADVLGVTVDYLLGKNNTPEDATSQEVRDLHRILDQGKLAYREEPISDEALDAVKNLLEGYYWAKGRNRVNHDNKG